MSKGGASRPHVAHQLHLDVREPALIGDVQQPTEGRRARVVDDDVDAAELLRRAIDERLHLVELGHVGCKGDELAPGLCADGLGDLVEEARCRRSEAATNGSASPAGTMNGAAAASGRQR